MKGKKGSMRAGLVCLAVGEASLKAAVHRLIFSQKFRKKCKKCIIITLSQEKN